MLTEVGNDMAWQGKSYECSTYHCRYLLHWSDQYRSTSNSKSNFKQCWHYFW